MSVRGHPEWVPKRASMYSAAYNTAPDTENHPPDNKRYYFKPSLFKFILLLLTIFFLFRNDSPSSKRLNGRKGSCSTVIQASNKNNPKIQISPRLSHSNASGQTTLNNHHLQSLQSNNNNADESLTSLHTIARSASQQHNHHPQQQHHHQYRHPRRHNWLITLCFRGQKVLRVPGPAPSEPPESVVFELSEQ